MSQFIDDPSAWGPRRTRFEEEVAAYEQNFSTMVECPFVGCDVPVYSAYAAPCPHSGKECRAECDRQDAEAREPDPARAMREGVAACRAALAGLTEDRAARKAAPMHRGLKRYFPNALAYVSHVSHVGNEQHNPGEPMHWAYDRSTDEGDCIERHQAEAGTFDTDGLRHSGKVAWRALAQLERELLEADPSLKPGLGVRNFARGSK